jgi:uroporphyrinogen-III synthase
MVKPLTGKKVMILRPHEQSEELCRLVTDSGGIALKFPTLVIEPTDSISKSDICNLIAWSELIIFVSRNSVRVLSGLLGGLEGLFDKKSIFAAGEGTAVEAEAAGIKKIVSPDKLSGSDGLLLLAGFNPPAILGEKVLIVRGETGRELLKTELESRGALVKYAEIYTRALPSVSKEGIEKLWQQNPPDIIVLTSKNGLYNLIKLTPIQFHDRLFSTDIVAISKRIADAGREAGFTGKASVAKTQSDHGLYDAVIKFGVSYDV